MVIGKSGTGKTAPINFLLSQVQRFDPKPTIFFFDKDRGVEKLRACLWTNEHAPATASNYVRHRDCGCGGDAILLQTLILTLASLLRFGMGIGCCGSYRLL
jgi:hypothetical protein